MSLAMKSSTVETWSAPFPADRQPLWQACADAAGADGFHSDPRWLTAIGDGLRHSTYMIDAECDGRVVGLLPLSFVRSMLFGRFLVSLPYVNSAGIIAQDDDVATVLIDQAVELADQLNVRYLELRHESERSHPAMAHQLTSKVHMRLPLPDSEDELWKRFKPKVRNQIRKGEKHEFTIHFGHLELLEDFYAVFSRNMRDLGTPVFGRSLFRSILGQFPDRAELCVVRQGQRPAAAAILVHGNGMTEVPSASSLRELNRTNVNMLMYWHLLRRTIQREQGVFDFGRSTIDGNTYRFKKQWGAMPEPAVWQYYVRQGDFEAMRRESGSYDRMIRIWQRLPLSLTRLIGPPIVRGIP